MPIETMLPIQTLFNDAFGAMPARARFTPGRVNLIGEHIDYNGGTVLPLALKLGTMVSFTPRDDKIIRVISDKFDDMAECHLDDVAVDNWYDYVLGAMIYANKAGFIQGGADVAVMTNLPFGAGLSSSAALTVGLLKLARDHAQDKTSDTDIAVLARKIENDFIGVPCGIMDQMAVAIASPGQALALNTETLEYDLIDLPKDYHIAVIHSGQFRQLNEGRYKERKEECDAIKAELGHNNICQISDARFETLSLLPNTLQRRARHCMTDHRRTVEAITCLRENNLERLGILMSESHASMRDDFEITVPKVDALVEDAVKLGALGARQTGGGFGGCIVACIAKHKMEAWKMALLEKHPESFWVS